MPQGNPRPGERYLHFKNKMYQIVCLAHHSETDERLVVYQALYGEFGICARPFDMFISEVDHEKYPEVTQKYRFTYVEANNDQPFWTNDEEESLEQANPWLMKFLDAETFDEKYDLLGLMYRDIDNKLIDDIAVCMDVVIPDGELQERYMQLKQCIRTRQKYEGTRV